LLPALCPLRTRYVPCGQFSSGLHQKLWITLFHTLAFKDYSPFIPFSKPVTRAVIVSDDQILLQIGRNCISNPYVPISGLEGFPGRNIRRDCHRVLRIDPKTPLKYGANAGNGAYLHRNCILANHLPKLVSKETPWSRPHPAAPASSLIPIP